MKNVIFLLVDCFDYNKIGSGVHRNSPTPFLDTLKEKSYFCERMYSQAPYTEAALIATMCGYDTLSRGGYLKRYKNAEQTLFELFQQAGYQVYSQMWPHFHPSSSLRGIDFLHLRPFSFMALWAYRFEYYIELFNNGELDEFDRRDLIELLDENLNFWQKYLQLLIDKDESVRIIIENMDISKAEAAGIRLKAEIESFNSDKELYLTELLQKGREHSIFEIFDSEALDKKLPKDFVLAIANKYKRLNEKIFRLNNSLNIRNNRPSLRALADYFRRSETPLNIKKRTQFSQALRNYYRVTHLSELLDAIGESYDLRKDWLSTKKMMDYFFEWHEKSDKSKPYFAYMHTEAIHGPGMVFDICSNSEAEIDEQMKRLDGFLDRLPRSFRGNLGYELGLLNLDNTIKNFCRALEERGMLKDTLLVITSDHGCGTNYSPIRGLIQNFHDECYHVPFIVYGADVEPKIDSNFHITKDIMASLADFCEIPAPKYSNGISVLSSEKRSMVNQEYMGPGCPDIYRRPIWFCAFDKNYKVFVKAKITSESFSCQLEEIYDLKKDRLEIKNLAGNKKVLAEVEYLIKTIEKRWGEIKAEFNREGNYEG